MPLILPNTIANEQDADGDKLQQNFASIQQYINLDVVTADGSTGMTQPLLLPGAPTQPNQAATKAYVDASVLVGEVKMWPGTTEPANYMFCRGQAISRATYAGLFAVLGTAYGAGDGSTTFQLPNYKGRSPLGVNDAGQPFSGGVGEVGGVATSILPQHYHAMNPHTHPVNIWTNYPDADHAHLLPGLRFMVYSGPGSEFELRVGDGVKIPMNTVMGDTQWSSGTSGNHRHAINGNTDNDSTHTTGYTDQGAGESGHSNYHPVVTINFIIKVL